MGCSSSKPNDVPDKKDSLSDNVPTKKDASIDVKCKESKSAASSISTLNSEAPMPEPERANSDAVAILLRGDSVLKIQRFARKTIAKKSAQKELHWKIFSDLDSIEEAEMAQLGKFMKILLKEVPQPLQVNIGDHLQAEEDRHIEKMMLRACSVENMDVGSVGAHNQEHININGQFEIPKSGVTLGVAGDIIELYREGGKISAVSMTRILRRAYNILKALPTVVKLAIPEGGKVNVIGDLHGNIHDLIHIIDECGLPSASNKYVFNGNFVGRGENGLEVLTTVLVLLAASPEHVVLNRGYHEEGSLTSVYGFEGECIRKYDELTFGMFTEIFRYLSVFVVVSDTVLVVHGGLFNNRRVTIKELESINRYEFVGDPLVPYPESLEGLDQEGRKQEYLHQLMRDALGSDTQFAVGLTPSPRGTGVLFGPDIAQEFMSRNHLSMIIRSHECVRSGFFLPYEKAANPAAYKGTTPLLCTVFSASNYLKKGNEGAYLVLMDHQHSSSHPIKDSGFFYSVHQYKTSGLNHTIEQHNQTTLGDLIMKKRVALTAAFEALDSAGSGKVTRAGWAEVMQAVTTLKIRWLGLITTIAPAESLTIGNLVDYKMFMKKFSVHLSQDTADDESTTRKNLDMLYVERKKLELVFNYFDKNGDGKISLEEFRHGCQKLNERLREGQRLTDIDHVLDMLDLDCSGMIDINEFFEAFRIVDNKVHFTSEQ